MGQFFKEAGTVVFLILIATAVALPYAVSFAYRPTAKKKAVANAFNRTILFAALTGYTAGMVGTLQATVYYFDKTEQQWWQVLIQGARESANNLLLGFGMIAICSLFVAVGEARNKAL